MLLYAKLCSAAAAVVAVADADAGTVTVAAAAVVAVVVLLCLVEVGAAVCLNVIDIKLKGSVVLAISVQVVLAFSNLGCVWQLAVGLQVSCLISIVPNDRKEVDAESQVSTHTHTPARTTE